MIINKITKNKNYCAKCAMCIAHASFNTYNSRPLTYNLRLITYNL